MKVRKKRKNEGIQKYVDDYCLPEFELLNNLIEDDETHNLSLTKPNNYLRYNDIRTYYYNNVKINSAHRYINASWIHMPIQGMFIATLVPLNNTIEDFWTMCDEYDIEAIVMLCKLKEDGNEKCANYWDTKYLINYEIKKIEEKDLDNGITLRKFQLMNIYQKNRNKYITQINLNCWVDHTALNEEHIDKIITIIKFVDQYRNNKPVVIHCSAGVGRTGTFISLYNMYHEIMQQIYITKNEIIQISVFNLVRKLKEMRMFMVENENQYYFLYVFLNYILAYNN